MTTKQYVLKTWKTDGTTESMIVERAAWKLANTGYFKTTRQAKEALLSGVPVQTDFAVYELEQVER